MYSHNAAPKRPGPSRANQSVRLGDVETPIVQQVITGGDVSLHLMYEQLVALLSQQALLELEPVAARLSPAVATTALAGHEDGPMQYDPKALVQEAQTAVSQAFRVPEGLTRADVELVA